MLNSEETVEVISRCGGLYKPSILSKITNPVSFMKYLKRRNELHVVLKRYRGVGEYVYALPEKYINRYWRHKTSEIHEFMLFKSIALLLYYSKENNLPYTKALFKKHFSDLPKRAPNGVFPTIDDYDDSRIIIILDYFRTLKHILEVVDIYRRPLKNTLNPRYHIVTGRSKEYWNEKFMKIKTDEVIEIFSFEELKKVF